MPAGLALGRVFPTQKRCRVKGDAVCRVVGFAPFDVASPVVLTVTTQPLAISIHGLPTLMEQSRGWPIACNQV